MQIKLECTYNPWYFIREVMRVPPAAGDTPVPLRANRANVSLWWCFLNHIDYFLIQPRQTGKSLNTDGISNWYQIFGARNSRANLFTKNGDLIKENIARLKKIRKLLPKYLVEFLKTDTDNQKEFTNYAQGNRMVAVQAQANEDAARNVGRGLTAPYNHTDEVAFLKFVHISVPVMLAGSGAARDEARRNGMPFCNIFTTTAGKIDTDEGKFAYTMLNDGMVWTELLYDSLNQADLYATVKANCAGNAMLINGTFSHRQLGFTDAWLAEKIGEARQTGDEVRRDFLNQWTAGTLSNPLETNVLEVIRKSVRDPIWQQKYDKEKYIVRWYVEVEEVLRKIPNRKMIMGLDTSNAVGRDAISGVILDVTTLETIGAFTINDSNLHGFMLWLARFLAEYKGITLIPENKLNWQAMMDSLLIELPKLGEDPGRRIYNLVVDRKGESEADRRNYEEYCSSGTRNSNYKAYRKYFGFPTNAELRNNQLYGTVIQEAAKRTGHLVRDQILINEISSLTMKNNRIDHSSGKHDDHVMAWLMAHWFLTFAKNLDHYGIKAADVKRKVYEAAHELSWKEVREEERQAEYLEEVDQIRERMSKRGVSEIELMKLEHRLNALYRRIDREVFNADFGSLDAFIQNAAEQRTRKRTMEQGRREMGARDNFRPNQPKRKEFWNRVVVEC